jgi:hypothetical protein
MIHTLDGLGYFITDRGPKYMPSNAKYLKIPELTYENEDMV